MTPHPALPATTQHAPESSPTTSPVLPQLIMPAWGHQHMHASTSTRSRACAHLAPRPDRMSPSRVSLENMQPWVSTFSTPDIGLQHRTPCSLGKPHLNIWQQTGLCHPHSLALPVVSTSHGPATGSAAPQRVEERQATQPTGSDVSLMGLSHQHLAGSWSGQQVARSRRT